MEAATERRTRRLRKHDALMSVLDTADIAVCLSGHLHRSYAGLAVTLCTDGWLMSGVSLTDEYWLAHTALGFSRQEIDRMILTAFEHAFLPWPERQALLLRTRAELEGLR